MQNITRREFLKYCAHLAALFGLSPVYAGKLGAALERIGGQKPYSLWLQGLSCSGCSVSMLNSTPLGIAETLMKKVPLAFNSTLSGATGEKACEIVDGVTRAGNFYLVVEGAVPAGMGDACTINGKRFPDQLLESARNALAVIAAGTCASFGGIAAVEGNPTGAVGVPEFLKANGINKPVVVIPGCPVHPDWLIGALAIIVGVGVEQLKLDSQGRPQAFFSAGIHEQCSRLSDFKNRKFAKSYGEEGCLIQLGCRGPRVSADCNSRLWNGGANCCTKAGAPCVGCAGQQFPGGKARSFDFVENFEYLYSFMTERTK